MAPVGGAEKNWGAVSIFLVILSVSEGPEFRVPCGPTGGQQTLAYGAFTSCAGLYYFPCPRTCSYGLLSAAFTSFSFFSYIPSPT